ncbi:Concanavalin A-like lectin/glucanases superfamily protein [Candidatus Anstonella stagnisolia]|nr:Concanavalin A-like lectin/glucanases superfamily protein [Candidatus Anstonella stagnisolia]
MGIYRKPTCLKAQAAAEYLVILGAVLLISTVAIALLDFFPGMSADSKISQSDSYWQASRPFAILAHTRSAAPVGTSGYWAFDEGAGSTASDSVGGLTGSVSNAQWADGKYGSALDFSGNGSYAYTSSAVSTTNSITVEAWVNPESLTSYKTIAMIGSLSNTTGGHWLYFYSGRLYWRYNNASAASGATESVVYTPPLNAWTHITVTHDYDAKEVKFYVNGVQQGATQTHPDEVIPLSNKAVRIGSYSATSYNFNGTIDNVRVYENSALAPEEISSLASRAAEGMQMVLQNNGNNFKTISIISVGGQNASVNTGFGSGEKKTLSLGIAHDVCASGNMYEYNVSITYSTADMGNLRQTGAQKLVGKCS